MTTHARNTEVGLEEKSATSPLAAFVARDRELAPHLRAAIEKLSTEHPSGISIAQHDTPMMKQYIAAKDEVPDAIVFFRMGDFFELFGADAVIAADICGLTLTSRDKNSANPIPMAGVPVVNYRSAIKKCVVAGFKVAVVDQVEDPRIAKGLVRREIVRIATPAVPGDLGEEDTDQSQGCYLACVLEAEQGWTIAFVDVSTGELRLTGGLDASSFQQELSTISPREILAKSDNFLKVKSIVKECFQKTPTLSPMDAWIFRSEKDCSQLFGDFFGPNSLSRFGVGAIGCGLQAVVGLLAYLKATQRDVLKNIQSIQTYEISNHLLLCEATKRHLDFFYTAAGDRRGSLFWFLNKCATAVGGRFLARRLNYPFKSRAEIEREHAAVAAFLSNESVLENLASTLRSTADIERLVAKAAQGNLDPRGMAWLRQSLFQIPKLHSDLFLVANEGAIAEIRNGLQGVYEKLKPLFEILQNTLDDDPASVLGKGGKIFRSGFSAELDEITALEQDFDGLIASLEKRERENSQITTLKIGYTKVFGYYFEISKGKLSQVPPHFIRKQTLTNGERYTTPELKELEDKSVSATERRILLERELFESLRQSILANVSELVALANLLGRLDVVRNFASLAQEHNWCRPKLVDEPVTALENSVHPILQSLQTSGESFVPNHIVVGQSSLSNIGEFVAPELMNTNARILLITGPNMAGKSTVMRQTALAQILCQCGSFVPATLAVLGVCDKIFTRIGSADYALRNQSTFMVEMLETAQMLRSATQRSMLLMDELGRGTSTYDGLSLAWAILEDIHDRVGARTLFSTHYHELLEVTRTHNDIVAMEMEVIERARSQDLGAGFREIIFSRRFVPGAAGRSYGLHVAELAGIAPNVIGRASEILAHLSERKSVEGASSPEVGADNMPISASAQAVSPPPKRYRRNRDIPLGTSLFDFFPYTRDLEAEKK